MTTYQINLVQPDPSRWTAPLTKEKITVFIPDLARVASFSTDTRFGIVGNAASSLVKNKLSVFFFKV
jgi:hypothetical protein